jgi:hypothetical protein
MSSLSPNTGEKVNKNVCTWVGGVDQVPIQGLEFNPSAAPQKAVHSTSLLLSHKPVCHWPSAYFCMFYKFKNKIYMTGSHKDFLAHIRITVWTMSTACLQGACSLLSSSANLHTWGVGGTCTPFLHTWEEAARAHEEHLDPILSRTSGFTLLPFPSPSLTLEPLGWVFKPGDFPPSVCPPLQGLASRAPKIKAK